MKKIFFLAATAVVLVMSSCKKDNVDRQNPDPDPDPTPTPSARILKKMTQMDNGETTVYTLTYDGKKRLISIIADNDIEKTLFTYDAAGNLVQVEQSEAEFHNIYSYNYANNIPQSGTFKSWMRNDNGPEELIEDDLLSYTVENNQVKNIHLVMTLADNAEVDFAMQYTSGNLTKVTAEAPFQYTAEFTFGNKKPVLPAVSKWVLDHAGFSLQYAAKNELLSASYDFLNDDYDRSITTQYTYDANGYVLTSTDGTATIQFEYE